jgi:hypothetical protein
MSEKLMCCATCKYDVDKSGYCGGKFHFKDCLVIIDIKVESLDIKWNHPKFPFYKRSPVFKYVYWEPKEEIDDITFTDKDFEL